MAKHVYFFGHGQAEGDASFKNLLGGKGANLAEMTTLGIPVPPGFTITTDVCTAYYKNNNQYPQSLRQEVKAALGKIEEALGKRFGDPANPLLLSVRSGARVSMPGMMDTVLNLGLNDKTVAGLAAQSGNPRFAYDSYRRFIQMYSNVVLNLDGDILERLLEDKKKSKGIHLDTELSADDLKELVVSFKARVQQETGKPFPDDPEAQLWAAIDAVFGSWMNKRAIEYRRISRIPEEWGTAVTVQSMVFGNLGDDCATGVAFTRDPSTGEKHFFGEFLSNAQGEDVVAGIRTPQPINIVGKTHNGGSLPSMEEIFQKPYQELVSIYKRLESHYRDMQDIEFTVERNKLWMLQTRNGKRTAQAAVRIAVEMVEERLISKEEAILRVNPEQLDQLLHPMIDEGAKKRVLAKGLPASPGAASGAVVFSAEDAQDAAAKGKKVILVRLETSPEDIHGMHSAAGILTARGGMTCVAGETKVLTDRGFLTAQQVFSRFESGEALRILSFDSRTLEPVWRTIIAAGTKPAEVITASVSQTGRVSDNELRLTPDHKLFTIHNRQLVKKKLEDVLDDDDFITVVDRLPASQEEAVSPALAYVAGAILSDGYIKLTPTKGSVTFIQKPTPEKADFIAAVEHAFEKAFGVPFSYLRERVTEGKIDGRVIRGNVEDRICFRRDPAARLMEIKENLSSWILSLDESALLWFLAGYADGDGSYAEESSAVRVQITVSQSNQTHLEGLALACLRLGIVPQITSNREHYCLQIVERVDEILAFTQRIKAEIPPRKYESKCLSMRALFTDIVDQVNFMGRVREAIKRNLLFGVEKIRRDILPLCSDEGYRQVEALLKSSLRSFRLQKTKDLGPAQVYNFEVETEHELDKNFIVFTSRLTPVLVSNSHAAVVARGMGKCCIVGCGTLTVDYASKSFEVGGVTVKQGDQITLNGTTGEVILGEVATVQSKLSGHFKTFMTWVDELRRLKVRTNSDTPHDTKVALDFGAEGIGLCRTEHMFFDGDRIEAVRQMILSETEEGRRAALDKILPMQKEDFKGIFKVMKGLPVTIRLLDPPLHEFLPQTDEEIRATSTRMSVSFQQLQNKVKALHEFNPMLGHRGCRLGITYPEIYEMQVRAIIEAACEVEDEEKTSIVPEIMIPLVSHANELALMRELVEREAVRVLALKNKSLTYRIGTMIELPRAAITADEIAHHADFFSFGTNDLTQTIFGFSRDDAGKFLPFYVDKKILPQDPFVSLDQGGVGKFIELATRLGRGVKAGLKLGICGEHGGDPASVEFCHRGGLDYVSCSPYRVPIARLAAAQAAVKEKK